MSTYKETIPEIVDSLYNMTKSADIGFFLLCQAAGLDISGMSVEPIDKINAATKRFRFDKNLPLPEYAQQLVDAGGELLNGWIEHKKGKCPELPPLLAQLIQRSQGDMEKFVLAVYTLQHQNSWVYLDADKKERDPCFDILLETARLCKRYAKQEIGRQ